MINIFKKNNNFIERSILGALSFLKESIFADVYARRPGFLQSQDPRVKTITFLLFIIGIMLTKSIAVLLWLYALCLLLVLISEIKLGFFLKRTWIFIPLFSLFIALPAMFGIFTPGQPLTTLRIASFNLVITRQGLAGASLFVSRVITSVSFAVLLSITTKHFALLKVLRIFKVPQLFVMTVGICYRYVYLFVEIIEHTYLAIKSRVGSRLYYKKGQHIVAWNIACLWARSYQLNEQVYQAMLSRGYSGEPVVLDDYKTALRDWLWLLLVLIVFFMIIFLNFTIKI
jgi:cobalt/nickel transport system permease protein